MVLSLGFVESYEQAHIELTTNLASYVCSTAYHGMEKQHQSATSNKQCLSLLTTMKIDTFCHLVRLPAMIHTVLAAQFSSHTHSAYAKLLCRWNVQRKEALLNFSQNILLVCIQTCLTFN